ncbi:MAG: tetraacyldisaccharide 4'-kinase, partial [Bdellovibrionales bacterium]|nr:tetraacyldisaccharide 4'-kinase [Bdellovibrionales bacterium]
VGNAKVASSHNAVLYGDEPAMVAKKFPDVPFYIGADRVAVAKHLLQHEQVNIIFADDVFKNRRLGSNLDIVIVDGTEELKNYQVLPVGRGRECQSGLKRADFIIVNKVNLITPDKKREVLDYISQILAEKIVPVIESEYYVKELKSLDSAQSEELVSNERVLLFSGLGNPKGFEDLMNQKLNVVCHEIFRDHYQYSRHDLQKILSLAAKTKVKRIITTEKDAVKISSLVGADSNIWVAQLAPKLSLRVKSLHEKILSICR